MLLGCDSDEVEKAKRYERIYLGSGGMLCAQTGTIGLVPTTVLWCQYVSGYSQRCVNRSELAVPQAAEALETFADWSDCWSVVDRCMIGGGPCPVKGLVFDGHLRVMGPAGGPPDRCLSEDSEKMTQPFFLANQGSCTVEKPKCTSNAACERGDVCTAGRCGRGSAARRLCLLNPDAGLAEMGWVTLPCPLGAVCVEGDAGVVCQAGSMGPGP